MRSEQYARYERAERPNLRLSTLVRIARALDRTVADLLRGMD
jgi:transcriptional regulator with XRE-family HTH domain